MPPKTIGLIAHTGKPGVGDLVNAIVQEFGRFRSKSRSKRNCCDVEKLGSLDRAVGSGGGSLVVVGGDGTILHVVGQLGEVIKPIFGINVGSPVFDLCEFFRLSRRVGCIAKDRINFSQRTLLEARIKVAEKPTKR
jgi:NAD kinase